MCCLFGWTMPLLVLLVLSGVVSGGVCFCRISLTAKIFSGEHMVENYGCFNGVSVVSPILGPFLCGIVEDHTEGYTVLFALMAAAILLCFVCIPVFLNSANLPKTEDVI